VICHKKGHINPGIKNIGGFLKSKKFLREHAWKHEACLLGGATPARACKLPYSVKKLHIFENKGY
jgi:hypothetical protein